MACRPRLSVLLLLLAVACAHLLALDWLARQPRATALRPLPPPMYTRLLRPEAPPQPPVQEEKQPPARAKPAREAINSIASISSAPVATPTAALPAPPPEIAEAAATIATPAIVATPTATLDSWPADTRLNYRLGGRFRSGELYGSARVRWQREGSRYQVRVEIDVTLLASLVLTSQGEVTPQRLEPSAYEELRRSGPRGANLGPFEIRLANGRTVARPDGVQDTASQFVELAHRFATGQEALEPGRSVSLWMARPGAVDLWTYDITGPEVLSTPQLGEVQAFRLVPRPIANPRGNITAQMWFAPSLQYLPVRILVSMGDEAAVDLIVDSIEQR